VEECLNILSQLRTARKLKEEKQQQVDYSCSKDEDDEDEALESFSYQVSPLVESKVSMLEYIENNLHFHMREAIYWGNHHYEGLRRKDGPSYDGGGGGGGGGGDDDTTDDTNSDIGFVLPEDWVHHGDKLVESSLARALGLSGVEKYGNYFLSRRSPRKNSSSTTTSTTTSSTSSSLNMKTIKDSIIAARIFFLSQSLVSQHIVTEINRALPFIRHALLLIQAVFELDNNRPTELSSPYDGEAAKNDDVYAALIGFHIEVLNIAIMHERSHDEIRKLSRCNIEVIDKYNINPTRFLEAEDRNNKHIEFDIPFSECLSKWAQFRLNTFLGNTKHEDVDPCVIQCNAIAQKVSSIAPNKTLYYFVTTFFPCLMLGTSVCLLQSSEEVMKLINLAKLKEVIEYYEYDTCGAIYKNIGNYER
jgi:hypothetical protein